LTRPRARRRLSRGVAPVPLATNSVLHPTKFHDRLAAVASTTRVPAVETCRATRQRILGASRRRSARFAAIMVRSGAVPNTAVAQSPADALDHGIPVDEQYMANQAMTGAAPQRRIRACAANASAGPAAKGSVFPIGPGRVTGQERRYGEGE